LSRAYFFGGPLGPVRHSFPVTVPGLPGVGPATVDDQGRPLGAVRPARDAGQDVLRPGAVPPPVPGQGQGSASALPLPVRLPLPVPGQGQGSASALPFPIRLPLPVPGQGQGSASALPFPVRLPQRPPIIVPGLPGAQPARDDRGQPLQEGVADKAAGAVANRLFKDVLTFAVLTSPAWIMLLLYPRRTST